MARNTLPFLSTSSGDTEAELINPKHKSWSLRNILLFSSDSVSAVKQIMLIFMIITDNYFDWTFFKGIITLIKVIILHIRGHCSINKKEHLLNQLSEMTCFPQFGCHAVVDICMWPPLQQHINVYFTFLISVVHPVVSQWDDKERHQWFIITNV